MTPWLFPIASATLSALAGQVAAVVLLIGMGAGASYVAWTAPSLRYARGVALSCLAGAALALWWLGDAGLVLLAVDGALLGSLSSLLPATRAISRQVGPEEAERLAAERVADLQVTIDRLRTQSAESCAAVDADRAATRMIQTTMTTRTRSWGPHPVEIHG